MHLEGNPQSPRLATTLTGKDLTDQMIRWAKKRVAELENEDLWGFIFKSKSPSSGMKGVKVYDKRGKATKKRAVGIFARIFMEHFPLVPVEDEDRLSNPKLRENFIERIFALRRWREFLKQRKSHGKLMAFHNRYKLLILSHSPKEHRSMEKSINEDSLMPAKQLYKKYQGLLTKALMVKSTPKKSEKLLQHMASLLGRELSFHERQELMDAIDLFREGLLPIIVPITLIRHYANKYDHQTLKAQYYLYPHPVELLLKNHV
jgi:uncharacterized protein YbgA (DUF1722 family)